MKRHIDEQMRYQLVRAASRLWRAPLGCVIVASSWAMCGCAASSPAAMRKPVLTAEEAVNMPLEENILSVAAFYPSITPWIFTDDRSRVRGVVISSLYLGGPDHLGVFGDGMIRPRLYVLDADKENPQPPQLLKEWSYDPEQAMPFRSKKRSMMGYGYRFHLMWGDELDLAGKDIRITVVFERLDGTLIHSGSKEFRVPKVGR